jgi:hypothetical protein
MGFDKLRQAGIQRAIYPIESQLLIDAECLTYIDAAPR